MTISRTTFRLSSIALVLLPFVAASGQAKQQSSTNTSASARSAIDAANKRFVDLFNKGDVAEAAKVYASDAIVLPPNASEVKGLSAISNFWQGAYKQGVRNVQLTTTEFATHGNYAHELGTYQLEVRGADGNVVARDNGKYMVLWKRDAGGEWHWYRDIYNSDVAAPAK